MTCAYRSLGGHRCRGIDYVSPQFPMRSRTTPVREPPRVAASGHPLRDAPRVCSSGWFPLKQYPLRHARGAPTPPQAVVKASPGVAASPHAGFSLRFWPPEPAGGPPSASSAVSSSGRVHWGLRCKARVPAHSASRERFLTDGLSLEACVLWKCLPGRVQLPRGRPETPRRRRRRRRRAAPRAERLQTYSLPSLEAWL